MISICVYIYISLSLSVICGSTTVALRHGRQRPPPNSAAGDNVAHTHVSATLPRGRGLRVHGLARPLYHLHPTPQSDNTALNHTVTSHCSLAKWRRNHPRESCQLARCAPHAHLEPSNGQRAPGERHGRWVLREANALIAPRVARQHNLHNGKGHAQQ